MSKIRRISAHAIIDSRGNPTISATVFTDCGAVGKAAVPSGASTGEYEAKELRDGGRAFCGKGVSKAAENVSGEIAKHLCGNFDVRDLEKIDNSLCLLDGTEDKSRLGANAILGVSLACARAAADSQKMPLYRHLGGSDARRLPRPMMNILNGGAHADNGIDFQEFMIIPQSAPTFFEAVRVGCEVFHSLKSLLFEDDMSTSVGDEGGFAPAMSGSREALLYLTRAVEKAGYEPGEDVSFALDVAASEFYSKKDGLYHLKGEGKVLSTDSLIDFYAELCGDFPIISIEDPLHENDFDGTAKLTKTLGKKVQIVGDDLFVTNTERLRRGIETGAANAILIKPNQIGTLSQTKSAISAAKAAGYGTVMSHRSGETEDAIIADLAVAFDCGQIKTGSLCRGERTAKYNRLIEIERELGESAVFGVE